MISPGNVLRPYEHILKCVFFLTKTYPNYVGTFSPGYVSFRVRVLLIPLQTPSSVNSVNDSIIRTTVGSSLAVVLADIDLFSSAVSVGPSYNFFSASVADFFSLTDVE